MTLARGKLTILIYQNRLFFNEARKHVHQYRFSDPDSYNVYQSLQQILHHPVFQVLQ